MRTKAFTLIELIVALAIIAIIASVIVPAAARKVSKKASVVSEEPADSPSQSTLRVPVNSFTLYAYDSVLLASAVNALTNNGLRVQWLDDKRLVILR